MNTKLDHVEDWNELAKQANWSVSKLARICEVSPRTLERRFRRTIGDSPKAWLNKSRQHQAIELLRNGFSIKETSAQLGYMSPNHFSRVFKHYWGCSPTASTALRKEAVAPVAF
jgi:AraC-like DNA-binding protein